eukprot:7262651-Pyramimonas_sp.AAC.1
MSPNQGLTAVSVNPKRTLRIPYTTRPGPHHSPRTISSASSEESVQANAGLAAPYAELSVLADPGEGVAVPTESGSSLALHWRAEAAKRAGAP